jgi:hypothetical protein
MLFGLRHTKVNFYDDFQCLAVLNFAVYIERVIYKKGYPPSGR